MEIAACAVRNLYDRDLAVMWTLSANLSRNGRDKIAFSWDTCLRAKSILIDEAVN